MKKILFIIVCLISNYAVIAQGHIDLGLKAGLNTSKISTDLSDYTPETVNNYLFGAFARINLGRIYIQPELYFNSKGGEVIDEINFGTVHQFDLKTVDVPALLGFKLIDKKTFNLRVMAGPAFYFVTDKSVSDQLTEEKLTDHFFGWQYGAGIDFLFLSLDARMESYSNNLYDTPDFDSKHGNFVLALGVKLF
jgi:hypothetical protein